MTKRELETLATEIMAEHNTYSLYASEENLKQFANDHYEAYWTLKMFAEKLGYKFGHGFEKLSDGNYYTKENLIDGTTCYFWQNPTLTANA